MLHDSQSERVVGQQAFLGGQVRATGQEFERAVALVGIARGGAAPGQDAGERRPQPAGGTGDDDPRIG